tara:strand:+ start:3960 stop:5069 length:1110 start_codon:yes stop_codon:yes gene_type:complete
MYSPVAEIRLDHLLRNYRKIQKHVGTSLVVPVVKANGYGHGAVPVAKALQKEGVNFFSVFTIGEAIELRESGIEGEILIFSKLTEDGLPITIEYNLTVNVSHLDDIDFLKQYTESHGKSPKVHLKIDTGMTRLGVDFDDAEKAILHFSSQTALQLEGIYSHFATSDEGDQSYAQLQLKRFNEIVSICHSTNLKVKYFHIANSGGILNLPDSYFDLARIGMLMYGAYPSDETTECIEVEPVMNFKGPIVSCRRVKAGTPVSYGSVYTPEEDAFIAVVQTGFADGFPRNWYENGFVGYKGKNYKIAGRVCMDQLMVNFGDDEPKVGEFVLFFGDDGQNQIRIEDIAREINSTPYVLMTAIGGRTERIYVEK